MPPSIGIHGGGQQGGPLLGGGGGGTAANETVINASKKPIKNKNRKFICSF